MMGSSPNRRYLSCVSWARWQGSRDGQDTRVGSEGGQFAEPVRQVHGSLGAESQGGRVETVDEDLGEVAVEHHDPVRSA